MRERLAGMFHGRDAGPNVGQQAHLTAAAAEVAVECFHQLRLVFDLYVDAAVEPVNPRLCANHALFQIVCPLDFQHGLHLGFYIVLRENLFWRVHQWVPRRQVGWQSCDFAGRQYNHPVAKI